MIDIKRCEFKQAAVAAALTVAAASTWAQTLPQPPMGTAPVVNYEYDAQGNPTKAVQAPGQAGFGFENKATYDSLSRVKDATNPKNGKTTIGYDGLDRVTQVTDPRNLVTQYPRNGLGDATQLVSPDTGTATHTFDAAGNLKTRTDSRGVLATNTYDALNRLRQTAYTKTGMTSQTFAWNYDQTGTGYANGIGRLTSTVHPTGSTVYTYDAQGRILTDIQRVTATTGANTSTVSKTVTYSYDSAGNITGLVYPSGRKVTLTYTDGQLSGLGLGANAAATPVPLISGVQFEPFGGIKSWLWHTGSTTQLNERVYDTSGRVVRYRMGNVIRDLAYDAADRIIAYTHYDATSAVALMNLNQTFGYDENGRLTSINTSTAGWSIGYDANGNRTGVTLNGSSSTYVTEATSNRLTSVSNPARNFGYDAAGNTTSDSANYSSTYDASGRLATLTRAGVTTTYSYNGFGQRQRKFSSTGAASTVIFVYDQGGQLLGEYSNTGAVLKEYVWVGSVPVAMFVPNGSNPPTVYYLHTDHLNTPRVVTDTANNLRWRWLAEPFGTSLPEESPAGLGVVTLNLRFPGQYADQESGLIYNTFRDYDSTIGRYTQSDPIGLEGGVNTFVYVNSDAVSSVDPTGLVRWNGDVWFGGADGRVKPVKKMPGLKVTAWDVRMTLESECVDGKKIKMTLENDGRMYQDGAANVPALAYWANVQNYDDGRAAPSLDSLVGLTRFDIGGLIIGGQGRVLHHSGSKGRIPILKGGGLIIGTLKLVGELKVTNHRIYDCTCP